MDGAAENPSASTSRDILVVPSCCSNSKRRKTETLSSSELSSLCLNDLPLHLIQEVLQRIHTTKSAFLCKCVCKNWYSLISSPFFAHRFITHHFSRQYQQNPSALFIYYMSKSNGYKVFTFSDYPMFKSLGFELSCLPERKLAKPVATFNDLMLCSGLSAFKTVQYYICNPFTLDWVALPLLELDKDEILTKLGFVCEPYYFEDSQGECTINPKFRFRIVRFVPVGTQQFVVKTYRSETQQWHISVLEGSEYEFLFLLSTKCVTYNRKLLWYNHKQIFAYDPFNPQLSAFVNGPSSGGIYNVMGVCQGFLRFMQFRSSYQTGRMTLFIWELRDYSKWEWRLEDKVNVDVMIPESSLVQKIVEDSKYTLKPLSFHPRDKDTVYFNVKTFVISYNCQSRELKLVGEPPCNHSFPGVVRAFCIELPLWPTPIPRMD